MHQPIRPRRNRQSKAIRTLVQEHWIQASDFIYPLFIQDGNRAAVPIPSMPGINRYSIDDMLREIQSCMDLGLQSFILFPAVDESLKDKGASYSYDPQNFYLKAIRSAKEAFPESCIITDVAMDPYSSDGHDGIVENGKILNDESLPILSKMAIAQAQAGADIIGPSDMMDGRIAHIRAALDAASFSDTAIMSYTAKYASAFYGPFRDALESAPKFGDKKTYQMNPANRMEAWREAELDIAEGADYLMVKPALAYLDIISDLRARSSVPVVAYQVSGEYAMIKAASMAGWLDESSIVQETLTSIKRAGADIIISYFAKQWLSTRN